MLQVVWGFDPLELYLFLLTSRWLKCQSRQVFIQLPQLNENPALSYTSIYEFPTLRYTWSPKKVAHLYGASLYGAIIGDDEHEHLCSTYRVLFQPRNCTRILLSRFLLPVTSLLICSKEGNLPLWLANQHYTACLPNT